MSKDVRDLFVLYSTEVQDSNPRRFRVSLVELENPELGLAKTRKKVVETPLGEMESKGEYIENPIVDSFVAFVLNSPPADGTRIRLDLAQFDIAVHEYNGKEYKVLKPKKD